MNTGPLANYVSDLYWGLSFPESGLGFAFHHWDASEQQDARQQVGLGVGAWCVIYSAYLV